ncbi:MAG: extracellular solute-binding protein [Pirellulales bacterium]
MMADQARRAFLKQSAAIAISGCAGLAGCWRSAGVNREVVVYCSLDREFSEPVLEAFTSQTGIKVLPKYDIESNKSVGLAMSLDAESKRPRCDVFWNNEILQTLRLMHKGVLEPFQPAAAADFPPDVYDAKHYWHGLAARGRILLVNTERLKARTPPKLLTELTEEAWRDDVAMAKPLFGTTATHSAMLFALWGKERAQGFFRDLRKNGVQVLSGNKHVATAVGRGELTLGLTDTDDGLGEIITGRPVKMLPIGQSEDFAGALRIPNTLSLIKGAPNPEAGKKLIEYLLSAEVEKQLADSASGQIPLRKGSVMPSRLFGEKPEIDWLAADFEKGAAAWDDSTQFLREEFLAE